MIRSSLTPYAASMRDPDPDGARKFARQLWLEQGVVALPPQVIEQFGWADRNLIVGVVEKHFGKRGL